MAEAAALSGEPIEKARTALGRRVCDACLGRLFHPGTPGGTDAERGRSLREAAGTQATEAAQCSLCEGICGEYEALTQSALAALEGHEFSTFLIGSIVDERLARKERELAEELGLALPHPLKQSVNREVGLRVERAVGKGVDFKEPDIAALVDTRFNGVKLQIKSVYVRGRYRKLSRGLPQTRWPCRHCRGRGCARCGGTGRMYQSSVEEEIAGPLMAMVKGEDHALHGAGREDIDALMLGRGRPFAVEIRRPRLRSVDYEALTRAVLERSHGLVEVSDLQACTHADVAALKDADWRKTYRALVALEKDIKDDQINRACAQLSGSPIDQQTPTRVVHRRADKIRRRVVESIEVLRRDGLLLELKITGESGLYVKELVNGDGGRTKPSLTELLGVPCSVTELDVIEIHDK